MALIWRERKHWSGSELELDMSALEPGDRVAQVEYGTYRGEGVTIWTVDRFTPTRLVLKAGTAPRTWERQYRLTDGKGIGEGSGWFRYLKDPGDRMVITVLQRIRMRAFRKELEEAMRQRTEDLAQMDMVLDRIRELEEEVRSDLARMELGVVEVKASADAAA